MPSRANLHEQVHVPDKGETQFNPGKHYPRSQASPFFCSSVCRFRVWERGYIEKHNVSNSLYPAPHLHHSHMIDLYLCLHHPLFCLLADRACDLGHIFTFRSIIISDANDILRVQLQTDSYVP